MEAHVEQLVGRARQKDAAAFAQLMERFERTALALALAGTGDPHAAGDVVQDAFVRAWQRLPTLQEPARFGAWLAGIVRNLAADFRRDGRRLRPADIESAAPRLVVTPEPLAEMEHDDLRRRVNAAIDSLDELSRSAVVLRYYEGLTSRQIAELLEVTSAAVDMRLMRARAQLRQRLAGEVEGPEEPVISPAARVGGLL